MSGIDDLMSAMNADKDIAAQFSACTSPDEAVLLAKNLGYEISAQELVEAYKTQIAGMSSEELSNVAGGKTVKKYYNQQSGDDGQQG